LVALGVPDNDENIQWIGEKRQVKVYHEDVTIQLDIDSDIAYINNKVQKLDSPAIIHNSRTYLPAKFVGEELGYGVFWDAYQPAVVVVKNEQYAFNKDILDTMKSAIQNISNYEAELTIETLVMVSDSDYEEYEKKFVSEKVDLDRRLMEVSSVYGVGNTTGVKEYYSDFAKYYNSNFSNNYPTLGWQSNKYNAQLDEKTPYEAKAKMLNFQIDESLYGMLECIDLGETYCLYNITDNEALLNCFKEAGICTEKFAGFGKIKDLRLTMNIEKNFILPTSIKIEVEREITGNEKYGVDKVVTENTVCYLNIACDQDLSIVLPQ